MLTSRYDEAFRYAHDLHRDQTRKGATIPSISHLMSVSAIVLEHGGNEDQAIGGLPHEIFVTAMVTGMIAVRWMRAHPVSLKALGQS